MHKRRRSKRKKTVSCSVHQTICFKVEKIWGDSLDSIPSPSPSVKIQILAGKFTWSNKTKHCWVMSTNFLFSKVYWQCQQCFCPYTSNQVKFSAHNLNFHWRWRWWDQIQAIFLNLFYFMVVNIKSQWQFGVIISW